MITQGVRLKTVIIGLIIVGSGISIYAVDSYDVLTARLDRVSKNVFLSPNVKMFAKPTNVTKNPIDYKEWNNLLSDINAYVEKNNTDLLNRRDQEILSSRAVILNANNTIMSTIRGAYDNFFAQSKGGQDSIMKLQQLNTKVGGILTNEKSKLQKKRKSLTLDKKKKSVDLLINLIDALEKIYIKADTDSSAQMVAAFDKAK